MIEKKDVHQYVYLMKNEFNLFKVGISSDPEHRCSVIRVNSGIDTKLIKVFKPKQDIAYGIEQELHKKYAAHRRQGEWFNIDLTETFLDDCISIGNQINKNPSDYAGSRYTGSRPKHVTFLNLAIQVRSSYAAFKCVDKEVLKIICEDKQTLINHITPMANAIRLALILCAKESVSKEIKYMKYSDHIGLYFSNFDAKVASKKIYIDDLKNIFDYLGTDLCETETEWCIEKNDKTDSFLASFIEKAERIAEIGILAGKPFKPNAVKLYGTVIPKEYQALADYLKANGNLKIGCTHFQKVGLSHRDAERLNRCFSFDLLCKAMGNVEIELYAKSKRAIANCIRVKPNTKKAAN